VTSVPFQPAPRRAPAFTLFEVIVVVVIIGILAMLVVPRLFGFAARQAKVEAEAVALMISSLAQRWAAGSAGLALVYDAPRRRLSLEEWSSGDALEVELGRQARPPEWVESRLTPPVTLTIIRVDQVFFNGQVTDASRGVRLEIPRGLPRPALSLYLVPAEDIVGLPSGAAWQVDLGVGRTAATMTELEPGSLWQPGRDRTIDLDARTARSTAW
jgi:prepilin-type N-terminal cleavage/methylation domain-containing protein